MFTAISLPAVNHVLHGHPWAMQRLRSYAGQTAQVECGPLRERFSVAADGTLMDASPRASPDVTIRLTPGRLLRVLVRDDAVWSEVEIEGDSGFATTLSALWRDVDWDVEEDLSHLIGDIAAHRVADAGRRVLGWAQHVGRSTTESFAEYWTEERPLLARGRDIAAFNAEVDALRDDLARLEKRIAGLAARVDTPHAH